MGGVRVATIGLALLLACAPATPDVDAGVGGNGLPDAMPDVSQIMEPCLDAGTRCGASCVDLATNPVHCGACGNACGAGQSCRSGSCAVTCWEQRVLCNGECVDLQWDDFNCGVCGRRCDSPTSCHEGICRGPDCAPGQTACDRFSCSDLSNSESHCGRCGNRCLPGQVCRDGACGCPEGRGLCAGECVDITLDSRCGACNNRCAEDHHCVGGVCTPRCSPSEVLCERRCVDTRQDRWNCGACAHPCGGSMVCVDGNCRCPDDTIVCGGGCVDARTDMQNCGACGVACDSAEACVGGRCTACPGGRVRCGTEACAVDLTSNADHCGACHSVCSSVPFANTSCNGGRCVHLCRPGRADCDRSVGCEVDIDRDDTNCGACGRRCGSDERCRTGACVPRLPRPRRPMSNAVVLTRQPRFAWIPREGAGGTRIEVCTTRACDSVLRSADLTGDRHTFATPLAPGVYFWRVRGLRNATPDPRQTVVWPITISSTEGPLTPERVLADYNGDGREDPMPILPRYSFIERCGGTNLDVLGLHVYQTVILPIGDVDGDGFGDALGQESGPYQECGASSRHDGFGRTIAFGGPAGLQRSSYVTVEYSHIHNQRTWGDGAPEDYDGDGFADHLRFSGTPFAVGAALVRGADLTHPIEVTVLTSRSPFGVSFDPPLGWTAGDFDADLASELKWTRPGPTNEYYSEVRRFTGTTFAPVVPPRCDALRADPITSDPLSLGLAVAPDDDRDGVVDLLANALRDGSQIRVRWFGGAGAPREDRCALGAP